MNKKTIMMVLVGIAMYGCTKTTTPKKDESYAEKRNNVSAPSDPPPSKENNNATGYVEGVKSFFENDAEDNKPINTKEIEKIFKQQKFVDRGNLDFMRCKSSSCKIKIQAGSENDLQEIMGFLFGPGDAALSPFYNTMQVVDNGKEKDKSFATFIIIRGRVINGAVEEITQ